MEKTIRLSLYGDITHNGEAGRLAWQIYQSEALTRLRDVSLSSTPSRFVPHSMAASRFEHSVGVGYLAQKLCDWRQPLAEHRQELVAAALCHDIGSPPFSHIAELFFWDLTGRTHEEETARLLRPGSELAEILETHRADPQRVVETINGRDPLLGPLICGSIDLDNVDNSLHLLLSLGHDDSPYHPLRLLRAFRIQDGQVGLDSGHLADILSWQEGRRLLYGVLHSEPNLSASSMLYRALEYAYAKGHLDLDFFRMGESEAMEHLLHHSGRNPARLLNLALRWKHYPMVHQSVGPEDPRLVSLYDDWELRKEATDALARDLGLKPHQLALYVGRDRGEKAIDLPFYGQHKDAVSALFEYRRGPGRLAVFVENSEKSLAGTRRLGKALKRFRERLPESDPAGRHVFF